MRLLPSHHSLLTVGHNCVGIDLVSEIFGLRVKRLGRSRVSRLGPVGSVAS
jgi:hypothetical protein